MPFSTTALPEVVVGIVNGGAGTISGAVLNKTDATGVVTIVPLVDIASGTELKQTISVPFNTARSIAAVLISVILAATTTPVVSDTIICAWEDPGSVATLRTDELKPGEGSVWNSMSIGATILCAIFGLIGIIIPVTFYALEHTHTATSFNGGNFELIPLPSAVDSDRLAEQSIHMMFQRKAFVAQYTTRR
jgi:hypothetical protein